jgi:CSLREA domain-containing protein
LKVLVSLLIAACCLLALPSAALAVQYTVDSTLDEPDANPGTGGCLTAGSKCTLRAAIQESNASTLVVDEIHFDVAIFNGQLVDTITLGSLLPPIANPVGINAGLCPTQAGQSGPCAGIEASALSYGLSVENTDTVEISGLAITGATTGIRVVNSSQSFVARNNWLGEKLDGTNGSGANTGIWLDPESDKATIGGTTAGQGNVFVNNAAEGLDIEGASETDVLGNYFGVKADGATVAANGKNIEITDANGFEATGNEVGTKIEGAAFTSAACDGGCNVIAGGGLSTGINLVGEPITGEAPAPGPTTIRGNYVGLGADGATLLANGTFDILVGGAEDVTVGGESPGEANYIAGGGYGIYLENGEGLKVVGNVMGSAKTGADVTSPGVGVFLLDTDNVLPVQVRQNVIRMEGSVGVEVRFGGAEIKENFIEGAEFGIKTTVAPGPAGSNLIEKNVIGESTANGIRIEDEGNLVFGNSVYKSGAAGIRLQAPAALLHASKNKIGGNTTDRENNIRESGGDAIEIDNTGEEEPSQNEVARNKGDSNTGLFIDLIGATTNGGIQPPAFATAIQSSAGGTGAEPGATIRVFRKKTAAAGEIESFLGEATADGSGAWKAIYPGGQIPTGTSVAATQTSAAGGTSELSIATTAPDPVVVDPGKKGKDDDPKPDKDKPRCKNMTGKCNPGEVLETTITKGPKARTRSTTAKFKFSSTAKGAKFECKLDKKKFKPCKSPKTYKGLKPGKHVFKVRAVKGKTIDATPAKRKFKILQ